MHNARTHKASKRVEANRVASRYFYTQKQRYIGAYRTDVCTSGVAQLRDHLVAESSHMPCPRVQSEHVTSVSEELHDTNQYQHKRGREPDKKWRHNLTQHETVHG